MEERIRTCPECGSKTIITDPKHAELYCAACGLVIAEKLIDLGPEWRAFDEEQAAQRIRTGPPMSYRIHNKGLGTPTPKSLESTKRMHGLISMDSSEKTLSFALGEIDRMASALGLPTNIKEAASLLYRKAVKQNLIKGRSIEELGSAVLYITCRQYGVPRTLKEVAAVSRMPLKKIRRAYIFLLKNLELRLTPPDPTHYIPRFCSELGLSDATRERAIALMRETRNMAAAKGWGPTGTAAAAIYLAANLSGESVLDRDVARVAGITPITLKTRFKELEKRLTVSLNALSPLPDKGAFSVQAVS
ncbi:MAG: transcription initiation factor IIB [Methanophagales archaeon ANME-1-THS]|nr:MAG: transcription initiation factor IIB [Methanophagales archaeon ANME-1-THS]